MSLNMAEEEEEEVEVPVPLVDPIDPEGLESAARHRRRQLREW